MKYEKFIYGIGSLIIVGAVIMIILHIPHASSILICGLVVMAIIQVFHVTQLKKKIKELEKK